MFADRRCAADAVRLRADPVSGGGTGAVSHRLRRRAAGGGRLGWDLGMGICVGFVGFCSEIS